MVDTLTNEEIDELIDIVEPTETFDDAIKFYNKTINTGKNMLNILEFIRFHTDVKDLRLIRELIDIRIKENL